MVSLRLRKTKVESVAVIKFEVNNGVGNGCFKIKMWTNALKLTNMTFG